MYALHIAIGVAVAAVSLALIYEVFAGKPAAQQPKVLTDEESVTEMRFKSIAHSLRELRTQVETQAQKIVQLNRQLTTIEGENEELLSVMKALVAVLEKNSKKPTKEKRK